MNAIANTNADQLSDDDLNVVRGGASPFVNEGCIVISRWLPLPTYNPWLDPYSPQRRGA
jgi:hypothetical protein